MVTCSMISNDKLGNPICINQEDILDFQTARLIADQKARKLAGDPMLIAWFEARSGKFSPQVECCSEYKPGWVVYAESWAANITIDINNESYISMYRGLEDETSQSPAGE